ncbi:serine/threonine-protein kinase [Pontiellaceae bacterium B12219]|nr:serine/threonine-protein kinase [Pontiellaceae bacterium B12219]
MRYTDHCLLGQGSVKSVYKAFNNHTKRWVAMACLREDRGADFYDLFVQEVWLTASLNHPNIITVHDAGVDEKGLPFFTMDLKGDSNLLDRIQDQQEDRHELLEIFMKVCDAVAYAHSKEIVHLDLKPENIQADEFGDVLVCDWGLAKWIGETEADEEWAGPSHPIHNMTLVGEIKGSLGFMAPEQVIPGAEKNYRTDIFALGCILHLILTGHPPFTGTKQQIIEATRKGEIVPPRRQYPEQQIPEALEAVVMKAMAPLPEDRYDSVKLLRNEIFNFLSGYSTLAEKPGFFREARLFLARNRIPTTITFLAIVVLSAMSVLFIQNLERQREKTALERERAVEFATQAENVTTLYQDELDRSENERWVLARKLATSASDLKKLGIFIRPVETVREVRKLVDSAFALNPNCASARLQRFSLDCIMLDFKGALNHPVTLDSDVADYLLFVNAFSSFNFSEEHRPSVLQLTEFLYNPLVIDSSHPALMERVVAYDHAARSDKSGYAPVVKALLDYVNKKNDDLVMQYDAVASSLILSSNQKIRLVISSEWGSNECLLRFLPFRSFKPVLSEQLHLGDLQGLQIETLDLRDCKKVVIDDTLITPTLKKVYVRSGQLDVEKLRLAIQSNDHLEIIEE